MPVEWVISSFLFFVGDVLHRKTDGRDRHVDDQIDLFDVVPAPRDAGADIRLELMVGRDDRDRLAQHLAAEILDRHLRRRDRALAGRRRCRAGQSVSTPIFTTSSEICAWANPLETTNRAATQSGKRRRIASSLRRHRRAGCLSQVSAFRSPGRGSGCPHPRRRAWDYAARACLLAHDSFRMRTPAFWDHALEVRIPRRPARRRSRTRPSRRGRRPGKPIWVPAINSLIGRRPCP